MRRSGPLSILGDISERAALSLERPGVRKFGVGRRKSYSENFLGVGLRETSILFFNECINPATRCNLLSRDFGKTRTSPKRHLISSSSHDYAIVISVAIRSLYNISTSG